MSEHEQQPWTDELREALAAYAHNDAWAHWMKYMLGEGWLKEVDGPGSITQSYILPYSLVQRWQQQMNTPYANLPESEKESDRRQADRIIAIVNNAWQARPTDTEANDA